MFDFSTFDAVTFDDSGTPASPPLGVGPRLPLYLVGAGGGGVSYWPDGSGKFKDG